MDYVEFMHTETFIKKKEYNLKFSIKKGVWHYNTIYEVIDIFKVDFFVTL